MCRKNQGSVYVFNWNFEQHPLCQWTVHFFIKQFSLACSRKKQGKSMLHDYPAAYGCYNHMMMCSLLTESRHIFYTSHCAVRVPGESNRTSFKKNATPFTVCCSIGWAIHNRRTQLVCYDFFVKIYFCDPRILQEDLVLLNQACNLSGLILILFPSQLLLVAYLCPSKSHMTVITGTYSYP